MKVNAESEKEKNIKIKFFVFSVVVVIANVAVFKSAAHPKTWVTFVLISFVVWSISAIIYEFVQRRNKQVEQETFMNVIGAKTFFLYLDQKARTHRKKAFFTFLGLSILTWLIYLLPVEGILSFMFGLFSLVWFFARFGFNIFNIDFPTHLQLNENILSGKKDDRYLWSADCTKQISYEANEIEDELIRTFYIKDPKKINSFSFAPSELSQLPLFFESLAKIVGCDPQLFYQSTFGIAIPLHELSYQSVEKVKPEPIIKRSMVYLLFSSLWNMISLLSSKDNYLGHRNLGMKTRRGITAFSIIMAIGSGLQTISFFKPFSVTPYPIFQDFLVSEGNLSFIYVRKAPNYLVLESSDGNTFKFKEGIDFTKLEEHTVSKKPYVKVWYFPLKGSEMGWIAKLEANHQIFSSEQEQKSRFFREKEMYVEGMQTTCLFLIPAFLAWLWEFIVQYKRNKRIAIDPNQVLEGTHKTEM